MPSVSVGNNYLTPKRAIIRIHDIQACPPPPPRPSPKLVGIGVLVSQKDTSRLSDTPLGFFLTAPSNSSIVTTERSVQVKNNHIKLLPKKSSLSSSKYCVGLKPKRKSIDWAAGTTTTTATKKFEDASYQEGQLGRLRI